MRQFFGGYWKTEVLFHHRCGAKKALPAKRYTALCIGFKNSSALWQKW
jgi:hypothetical protein